MSVEYLKNTSKETPSEDLEIKSEKENGAEAEEDFEESIWDKVEKALAEENVFDKRGEKLLEEAISRVNINEVGKKEIIEKTGVIKKLTELSGKVRKMAEKKLLIAALGMFMFANYGSGDTKKIEFGETQSGSSELTEVESNGMKQIGRARDIFDKVKEGLTQRISSQSYLDKLKIEFDGNSNLAKNAQNLRIENLQKISLTLTTREDLNKTYHVQYSFPGIGKEDTINGYYDNENNRIVIAYDYPEDIVRLAIAHELLHASTRGNIDIPEKTKRILVESYQKLGKTNKKDASESYSKVTNRKDPYYKDPTERLVRKQILDLELKWLGIKQPKEKFTDRHYKKMMDAYRNGKFSPDAEDFIKRTKPDKFKEIFDNIAKNQEGENQDSAMSA